MHGERNPPTEPPCDGCMVDLDPENEDAAKIFQLVQGQIITRHNGQHDEIIDLNYPAVKIMMDLYQIRNQRDTFERVLSVFHFFLNERKDS